MIKLGEVARSLRESLGLSQKEAAEKLGISNVHLCNVEKGKAQPSPELMARYREEWGIDLYIFAWCQSGDVAKLPKQLRTTAKALVDGWQSHLDSQVRKHQQA